MALAASAAWFSALLFLSRKPLKLWESTIRSSLWTIWSIWSNMIPCTVILTAMWRQKTVSWSSTAVRSKFLPRRIRPWFRGARLTRNMSWNPPVCSAPPKRLPLICRAAQRKSSSPLPQRIKRPRPSSAALTWTNTPRTWPSFPTLPAQRTALLLWPRSSTTSSALWKAWWRPFTPPLPPRRPLTARP